MEQSDSEGFWDGVVKTEGVWDGVKLTEYVGLLESKKDTVLDMVEETLGQVDMVGEGEDETLVVKVVEEERQNVTVPEEVGKVDEERHNVTVPEEVGELDEVRHNVAELEKVEVVDEERHNVPVPESKKEKLGMPDTLATTEREYVFEGEALTLPVVDEERGIVTVPRVVGVIEEVVEDEQEPLMLKVVLKVVWVDQDIVEVATSLSFRDMLLKIVDVGAVDKEELVERDTVGEILCEDWEVKEPQSVPVTDDDTH